MSTSTFVSVYEEVKGVSPRVRRPSCSSPGMYVLSPPMTSMGVVLNSTLAGFSPSAVAVTCMVPAVVSERSKARFIPHSTGKSRDKM